MKISRILQFTAFWFLFGLTPVMASQNSYNETESASTVQQKSVSGKVSDKSGSPLPGVTLVVKGTTIGTITDGDGNYSLSNIPSNATLQFSFVGMKSQEVVVGTQSKIDIVLVDETIGIDEVVAIGYTTRKRGELTGSVNTIKSEEIVRTANSNVAKSLEGKVSGLIINDRGGYPGQDDFSLLIRGKSTLGDNSPLIIIDGVQVGSFSNLSPNDIESISVLKDASAAIYGARAANGVILIITKRGQQGKTTFNVSSYYKLSTFTKRPKMMDSYQFTTYLNEVEERYGRPLKYTVEDIQKYKANNDPINYPNTDWYDITMKDWSPEQRNSISASGGTEKISYFVSGDFLNQNGLFKSNDLNNKQYQVRSNIDIQVLTDLKVGIDLSGTISNRSEPGVSKQFLYKHIHINHPTRVGIYPNGLPGWGGENGANPTLMSSSDGGYDKTNDRNIRAKFSFDLKMDWITQGLKLNGFSTFSFNSSADKTFHQPWTVYDYNKGTGNYDKLNGYNFEVGNFLDLRESFYSMQENFYNLQLSYNRTFQKHTVRGFVATEILDGMSNSFNAYRKNLISNTQIELFAGGEDGKDNSGSSGEWGRLNYFGSVAYDYNKKYLIDFTLRYDGSQNFPKGKRFGTFPGVSAGWVLSEEGFFDSMRGVVSNLKIRASWAKMGNDRVSAFQYLTKYRFGGNNIPYGGAQNYYIFGENPALINTFLNTNVPNPNITWEVADNKNIGFDAILFDNSLSVNFNYFYQKRSDILITRSASIPDYTALQLPQENLGKVDNSGVEFELKYQNNKGFINYNIGGNFSYATNKVVYMDEAANIPLYRKIEGHPMDSYVIYRSDGIFKTQEEVDNTSAKLSGTKPGDVKYIDVNEDGQITGDDQVRKYTSPIPKIQFGVFGGIEYKGFSLNVLFQGQAKDVEIPILFNAEGNRPEFMYTERWTPQNIDAKYPRASGVNDFYNLKQSDVWMHNAAFVRLKELEIGYSIPKKWMNTGTIQVFLRGSNLLTFDGIKFLDPEMQSYNTMMEGMYPPLKSIMAGINIQL